MGLLIVGIVINGICDFFDDDEKINFEMIECLCGVLILGIMLKFVNVMKEMVLYMVKDYINLLLLMN